MRPVPLRSAGAPSSTLLKFLRAQSDGVPFFSANDGACKTTGRAVAQDAIRPTHRSRRMSICATSGTLLESSLFPGANLWPWKQSNVREGSQSAKSSPRGSISRGGRDIINSRHASSNAGSNGFWPFGKVKKAKVPLQPDDLPPLSDFLDDNASLGRTLRPANELKLRCTEFDDYGKVTLVNGEFKKSELIAKYGLHARDLRKIDSSLLPNILVRPSAILINLLHLRALIKHNRVLVFDAYGSTDSYTQSLFMYDLGGKLRTPEAAHSAINGTIPYEFRALEAVLISVTSGLEAEFETVRLPVVRVLRELEEDIDRDKLRHLLIYSKKLGTFEQKARLVRDAIDDLLEADDDLAAMYLTEKAQGLERAEEDHTEVEMLLESYHKVCDEIVQVSGNLVSSIRTTEEVVKAILDANRNSLMLLDLKFSIGTLGLGGGTFVAALYGMNLKNFIEESDLGFWAVSAWCTVFSAIVCVVSLRKLRRVQRVSMWGGETGDRARGRSGWARLTGAEAEGSVARRERERVRVVGEMAGAGREGQQPTLVNDREASIGVDGGGKKG